MLALAAVSSLSSLQRCHLRACAPPVRRATLPLLAADDAKEDYNWDAAWQRRVRVEETYQRVMADGTEELANEAEPRSSDDINSSGSASEQPRFQVLPQGLQKSLNQAIDVKQWRLPFFIFAYMRDSSATALITSALAWVIFYLLAVPAAYVVGPALGMQDVSGLDTQAVANAIFIPAWPFCLVVAVGVTMLLRHRDAPSDD